MAEPRKRVLCIEDDRETAALIAEELVERGFEVSVAHDGRTGLAAILKNMPDLVLSALGQKIEAIEGIVPARRSLVGRYRGPPHFCSRLLRITLARTGAA